MLVRGAGSGDTQCTCNKGALIGAVEFTATHVALGLMESTIDVRLWAVRGAWLDDAAGLVILLAGALASVGGWGVDPYREHGWSWCHFRCDDCGCERAPWSCLALGGKEKVGVVGRQGVAVELRNDLNDRIKL